MGSPPASSAWVVAVPDARRPTKGTARSGSAGFVRSVAKGGMWVGGGKLVCYVRVGLGVRARLEAANKPSSLLLDPLLLIL